MYQDLASQPTHFYSLSEVNVSLAFMGRTNYTWLWDMHAQ